MIQNYRVPIMIRNTYCIQVQYGLGNAVASGRHHVDERTCKHFGPQRHSESARVRTLTIILERKVNLNHNFQRSACYMLLDTGMIACCVNSCESESCQLRS